jgi:hypothetical protein
LSAGALSGSDPLRHADLAALALALPVFLATGAPIVAFLVAGSAWVAQRIARAAAERRIAGSREARKVALLTAATLVGPVWFMSLVVLAVGLLAGNRAGLAAALLTLALFTVALTTRMLRRSAAARGPHADPPGAGSGAAA